MKGHLTKGAAVAVTATLLITGCASDGTMTETGKGAAIGTAAGAALGAAIGSMSANAGRGALIGAIGGALAGGMVGAYMEEQRKDFEKALADEIAAGAIRVQKLPDDRGVPAGRRLVWWSSRQHAEKAKSPEGTHSTRQNR